MKTAVDERLKVEARAFELRYACEHCVHLDPATGACAEGYPNGPHRGFRIETESSLEFCKSFELE